MSDSTSSDPVARHTAATGVPALMDLAVLVYRTVSDVAERHDLTAMQGRLLCLLEEGPLRMAEIAPLLGIEKAALTGLVDRAERRSLVERRAVPHDRRAVHVVLTDPGSSTVTAFHRAVTEALDELISDLTPQERDSFRQMSATVVDRAWERSPA